MEDWLLAIILFESFDYVIGGGLGRCGGVRGMEWCELGLRWHSSCI